VLNPQSRVVVQGFVEPSLATAPPDQRFQFERHGYFVTDRIDHAPGRAVFNRVTGLKDSRGK
jgi:glutaminyl-tRNA synthetase